MKTKIAMLALLLASFLTGCNNKPAADPTSATTPDKDAFKVTFNAVITKDDNFQLFYNEEGKEEFDGKQMVQVPVKGSPEAQDIVFTLPADVAPMTLRFDLGDNKEQKQVKFTGFKIDYSGKTFNGGGGQFFKYFYPNGQVECDTVNGIAKIKIIDGPYDPIIGATQALKDEIVKLYPAK